MKLCTFAPNYKSSYQYVDDLKFISTVWKKSAV